MYMQQHRSGMNATPGGTMLSPSKRLRSGERDIDGPGSGSQAAGGGGTRGSAVEVHLPRDFDLAKYDGHDVKRQREGMAGDGMAEDESMHGSVAAQAGAADVTAMAGWLRAAHLRREGPWGPSESGFPAGSGVEGRLVAPGRAATETGEGDRAGGREDQVRGTEEAVPFAMDAQRWHKTQRSRVEVLEINLPPWQAPDPSRSGSLPRQAERGAGLTAPDELPSRALNSSTAVSCSIAAPAAAAAAAAAALAARGASEREGTGLGFDLNMAHGDQDDDENGRRSGKQQTPAAGGPSDALRGGEPGVKMWSRAGTSDDTHRGTTGTAAPGMSVPASCCSWNCVFFSLPCRRKSRVQTAGRQAGKRGEAAVEECGPAGRSEPLQGGMRQPSESVGVEGISRQ
ncbi:hypothetical protein CLOP_g14259 [Closterium sp. NIES-67]|nr:hypothetical protein CLOP_g14259 [Closterium sp. NIES-67]